MHLTGLRPLGPNRVAAVSSARGHSPFARGARTSSTACAYQRSLRGQLKEPILRRRRDNAGLGTLRRAPACTAAPSPQCHDPGWRRRSRHRCLSLIGAADSASSPPASQTASQSVRHPAIIRVHAWISFTPANALSGVPEITDTEEVTGSNPVSPISITPSQTDFATRTR